MRRCWALMQQADAAEARGDAGSALEIALRPLDHPGVFWRPWRVRSLRQLVAWQPILPAWVTSRWLLAQALAWVDLPDRVRQHEALELAIDTRGGERTLDGRDAFDARCRVVDHDWVYRQVRLYEHGVLDRFLRRVAAPDLVAGADRIRDWVGAPMDGFELVGDRCRTTRWRRLSTGEEVEALNLGASTLVHPGWAAIGRLVPIEAGLMFETAPLPVPTRVAQQVGAEPGDWVAAVRRACHDPATATTMITSGLHDYELLTDVPRFVRSEVIRSLADDVSDELSPDDLPPEGSPVEAAFLLLAALRSEMLERDVVDDDSMAAGAPLLAAALVEPEASDLLAHSLKPDDLPPLERLTGLLTSPAAEVGARVAEIAGVMQRSE